MRLALIALVAALPMTLSECEADPVDADGDGYTSDVDCDDANPRINPGAAEVCDGLDNDCDGAVDEGACAVGVLDVRLSDLSIYGDTGGREGGSFEEADHYAAWGRYDEALTGALAPASGWGVNAGASQGSEVTATRIFGRGEAAVQLMDSPGGGAGLAQAQSTFEVVFTVDTPTTAWIDAQIEGEIYERADKVGAWVVLYHEGTPFEIVINEPGGMGGGALLELEPGSYDLWAGAWVEASLSGYWDDYPGATARYAVEMTVDGGLTLP